MGKPKWVPRKRKGSLAAAVREEKKLKAGKYRMKGTPTGGYLGTVKKSDWEGTRDYYRAKGIKVRGHGRGRRVGHVGPESECPLSSPGCKEVAVYYRGKRKRK